MRCRRSVYLANAALFSFPPLGNEAAQACPVVLDDLLAAIGELFSHFAGEEESHVYIHDDAEPYELICPHLTLPVEDVPQSFSIDGGSPCEFCDADAACFSHRLHSYCN